MSFFFNGFPFGMGGGAGGFPGFEGFDDERSSAGASTKEVNNKRFYELLGVDKSASYDEIRRNYRKLAKEKHPDKGGNEEEFQDLQHAYEVLSDENKRKVYDTYGEEGLKEGRGDSGFEGGDLFDLLQGRMGGSRGKKKTRNVLHNLSVSLEDVYMGKKKYLEISRYRTCEPCKGTGSKDPNANTKCKGCDGRGVRIVVQRLPMGMIQTQAECTECNGEGFVIKEKDKCKDCKGQKVVKATKTIQVDIDKGAPDGKKYVFPGESDEVPGYEAGDVVVEITIEKHKKFYRKGADLVYNADISLLEALTGFELVMEHLDGRKIHIKSKPGQIIKPGVLKTVKECGMPFFEQPYRYGNLYISFNIVFPDKVNEDQKQKLEKVKFPLIL